MIEGNVAFGTRALVVDDDLTASMLMREALEQEGIQVSVAEDGIVALEVFERTGANLIFLDVLMPGKDGFAVCETIRRRSENDDVTIVMVTHLDDPESIERAYELGATHFITKPINWHMFRHQVRYLIRARNAFNEARRAEQRVREERAFLESVMESIADPIIVVGPDYRVLMMNTAARETAPDDVVADEALTCYRLCHHADAPCDETTNACPLQEVLHTKDATKLVHRHPQRDGAVKTFELIATPLLAEDGGVKAVILSSRDITSYLGALELLQDKELRLRHLVQHDTLTGLPNRSLLEDRLSQAIHRADRQGKPVAVLFIDFDRFKQINDSYGHAFGDKFLQSAAARLRGTLREGDTVARLGGDEFVIVLEDAADTRDAGVVAHKVIQSFSEAVMIDGRELFVTCSIGISLYPQDGHSSEDILRNADAAMYKAKAEGRSTFYFYTEKLTTMALERMELESQLHSALANDEFRLYFQPQIDLASGELVGIEALLRWLHPRWGVVLPSRFIPLAEETGLIVPLGEWVLGTACRMMARWQSAGLGLGRMAVNVNISRRQLHDESFVGRIIRILNDSGLDPRLLELEIAEATLTQDLQESTEIFRRLRDIGVEIVIDDFGTGYSSLNYLKRLPVTKLKIDRSFVTGIPGDGHDQAIVRAVIALGRSLQLKVVAKGVETPEQVAFLRRERCDLGQGYLFSHPLPEEALVKQVTDQYGIVKRKAG